MEDVTNFNWEPPEDAVPWIVCAACKDGDFIAAGPRHFDETMHRQITAFLASQGVEPSAEAYGKFEQGFIDQYGRFYSREDAMEAVKKNGQPFDIERNSGEISLFSEGLY